MSLYAISDLHLDLSGEKPMDVFGDKWAFHDEKIKENWLKTIKEEDTVLICGDISWSLKINDGLLDLEWVNSLPGKKLLVRGNHDYWWQGINKLNKLFDNMKFIQNNFFTYNDYAICGTRGWICPGGDNFTEHDEKIYEREVIRLKLSLDGAKKAGYEKIIVMIHYPPVNDKKTLSKFIEVFKEYGVQKVIYGHVHAFFDKEKLLLGEVDGIEYVLTSSDYIDFQPIKILSDV